LGDLFYYGGDDIEKDQMKALELYKMSAACYYGTFIIGKKYYEGSEYLKNTTIGLIYLNIAAFDKHSPEALRYLGDLFYYGGDSIDKYQVKALELHKTSANLFTDSNNFDIGKEYYNGSNKLKKNSTIGYIYLSKALDQKHQGFKFYLDDIYYFGECYEKDPKTALDLIMALENHSL
jgi:TPR repeat protein